MGRWIRASRTGRFGNHHGRFPLSNLFHQMLQQVISGLPIVHGVPPFLNLCRRQFESSLAYRKSPGEIGTGGTMVSQFHPWYLGMAHPFTLPLAVGGYDVPHHPRWRRPENSDIPFPRSLMPDWSEPFRGCVPDPRHGQIGPACTVKLVDITRGLPQRIKGHITDGRALLDLCATRINQSQQGQL